jgi:methyl-accepting chemotaxis protein
VLVNVVEVNDGMDEITFSAETLSKSSQEVNKLVDKFKV